MPKYEVLKSYDVVEVHHIIADNEDEAIQKVWESFTPVRTFDSDYDDSVSVTEIEDD